MAALMIPGSKLTDRYGRKRLFMLGLVVYAIGAVLSALSPGWERGGKQPLLSTSLFRNRTSNLGLVTQNTQWVLLLGTSFVVSAYLQVVRGNNAIETGIIFTAATLGLLVSSLAAERLAKRYAQRTLILAGFVLTIGLGVLLAMVSSSQKAWSFAPGLLLIGLGLGAMLTPSVNVVQSSFPENLQGEISGLSRSVSNLGSSLGTAIAGTILVASITATPERSYALAMIAPALIGLLGLIAATMLPAVVRTVSAHDLPQPES
jgi:MFS family permease